MRGRGASCVPEVLAASGSWTSTGEQQGLKVWEADGKEPLWPKHVS